MWRSHQQCLLGVWKGVACIGAVALVFLQGPVARAGEAIPEQALKPAFGSAMAEFRLKDFRGKEHALSDFRDAKLVVVTFLGCECPLAKLYAPRLAELAAEFSPRGVAFVGINSNRQDSITEMAAYARLHKVEFPLLKDLGNEVADRFGATRTPEVFVLDAERRVQYAGRIDDQYGFTAGSGYHKPKLTERDLARAIEELLEGKEVSQPHVAAAGCLIGRVRPAAADAQVTYSREIARILQNRCVECHREGQIAPFALTNYEEVAGWAEMIDEVVRQQKMPPWHANPEYGHFSNEARLSDEEKAKIAQWVAAGAPEGNPADLPAPQEFAQGWMIPGGPDVVIPMSKEPYHVPAEGVVDYQYFVAETGFTEDKWIKTAECMPGNRGVVHHIIVLVRPPEGSTGAKAAQNREGDRDARGMHFLNGFAPGTRPFVLPRGYAKKIPAGSKLVFQMHYTPNGREEEDISSIGLKFVAADEQVEYQVATTNAINGFFEIPPHADNHYVKATRKIRRDEQLLSLFPHMHLRGKAFRYTLIHPDGSKEILLDVPHYDFNWQNHFILSQPRTLAKGSKVFCEAYYDNSENNLANPDPSQPVRWGDQTWEEMMIGWFDVAMPVAQAEAVIRDADDAPAGEERPADDNETENGGE